MKRSVVVIGVCLCVLSGCDDKGDKNGIPEAVLGCISTCLSRTSRTSCDPKDMPGSTSTVQCGSDEYCDDSRGEAQCVPCPPGSQCGVENDYRCTPMEEYTTRYVCKTPKESARQVCHSSDDGGYEWKESEPNACATQCEPQTGRCEKIADFEGEDCSRITFEGYCYNGFKVSCDWWSGITITRCDEGLECMEVAEEGHSPTAYCAEPCQPGQTREECVVYTDSDTGEVSEYILYSSICHESRDKAGKVIHYMSNNGYEQCAHGCDENGCITLDPLEGKKCEEVTEYKNIEDNSYCKGNLVLSCEDSYISDEKVVHAVDCGTDACIETTFTFDDGDDWTTAQCVETCERSQHGKLEKIDCKDVAEEGFNYYNSNASYSSFKKCIEVNGKFIWDYHSAPDEGGCNQECTSAEKGKVVNLGCSLYDDLIFQTCTEIDKANNIYIYLRESKDCEHGCSTSKTDCYEPSENDECNQDTFKNTCEGEVLVSCQHGEIIRTDCTQKRTNYWGDTINDWFDNTCVQTPNGADCEPACTAADQKKYKPKCRQWHLDDYGELFGDGCFESQNHTYYFDTYNENCEHGCNNTEDGCLLIHPEEGIACDINTYEEKCVDGLAMTCYNGKTKASECFTTSDYHEACGVFEGHAACRETCMPEDVEPLELTCDEYSHGLECVKQGDHYLWHKIKERCTHGCNTDGTCIHIDAKEGRYCTYSRSWCENGKRYECGYDDHKIHAQDCQAQDKTCIQIDDYEAECR